MILLLCMCLLAGCTGNKAQIEEDIDVTDEEIAEVIDGYDPEVDDLEAERDDATLAGTVFSINGENINFTNSSLIASNYRISPNKTVTRNHKIDTITIHMAKGQFTFWVLAEVYAQTKYQASANYIVDKDGVIGMCVEERDRSWCSSNAPNDHRAITIVVASDPSAPYKVNDVAYESLIKLVADVCARNDIKKLVWTTDSASRIAHANGANMTVHRDFAQTDCPGDYLYDRMGEIAQRVNAMMAEMTEKPAGIPTSKPAEKTDLPYMVKITKRSAEVRRSPGLQYAVATTVKRDEVYTITEEKTKDSITWGKLKNGTGWINLADTEKVKK